MSLVDARRMQELPVSTGTFGISADHWPSFYNVQLCKSDAPSRIENIMGVSFSLPVWLFLEYSGARRKLRGYWQMNSHYINLGLRRGTGFRFPGEKDSRLAGQFPRSTPEAKRIDTTGFSGAGDRD
jgi:hypothetical protein